MSKPVAFILLGLWTSSVFGQTSVLTYHYDNFRTGQNTQETILTPANVALPDHFQRQFVQPVDGDVYAQPLYVPRVAIPGKGMHNVLFIATEGDSVYAFDADNNAGSNSAPLWKVSLIDRAHGAAPGATTVPNGDIPGCNDLQPQIGITSTPVIDPTTATLYVEATSKEGGAYIHRLHALDITTGAEKFGGPARIQSPTASFSGLLQHNRPGLLLANSTVYIAFASHCDTDPYHGWVFAHDAKTLAFKNEFIVTPNGTKGGVWMEGAGPAADTDGSVFLSTGNGTFDTTMDSQGFPAHQDYGDSVVKLNPATLKPTDYFTPFNQGDLEATDEDLGAGGVVLLPDQPGLHPHLLFQVGKAGSLYLIDRDHMISGHFCAGCAADTNIVQEVPNAIGTMGVPAYWNGRVYVRASVEGWSNPVGLWDGVLRAFSLSNGLLNRTPTTSTDAPLFASNISISANGNTNGIVWAINNNSSDKSSTAVLNAYDALSLSLLYSSNRNPARDSPGTAVKFTTPVVANGKVYVGASNQVAVFGLRGLNVQVTNEHVKGTQWCATVTATNGTTGQPLAGVVNIHGAGGKTNQELCYAPCVNTTTECDFPQKPYCRRISDPVACSGTVSVPGFAPEQISTGPL